MPTQSTRQKIAAQLRPAYLFEQAQIAPALISGVLVGLLTAVLSISFAVLVFGKSVPDALSVGIGMALFSNVVLHFGAALGGSGEGVVSHVQSLPPPIQAAMLASMMAVLPIRASAEDKTALAVLAVLFSAIFTGAMLFVFGRLKLGRLVRFMPLPVISGFLVSVGFALVLGGLDTMAKGGIAFSELSKLFEWPMLGKWSLGLLLAGTLWFAFGRWKNQMVFPSILVVSVGLFYLLFYSNGVSASHLMENGWLLGPFPEGRLWQPPWEYLGQIGLLDGEMIIAHLGILATIPLACFIGGLLMLSAIEFSMDKEVDPNFELKTMGVGNVLSGALGGGFIGYPSTTFTLMQHSLGAKTRLAGLFSGLVSAVVLVGGAAFLGFIPRFVVGGLLMYFGYQFIEHWGIKQIRHSSWADFAIILAIVVTSLWMGFVPSVGFGFFAAAVFFLFKYSQTSVIRYASTGATLRSRVTRNSAQDAWLDAHAGRIHVFGLQGFIFFGSAHILYEEIMAKVVVEHEKTPNSVILDFRHVTGIDSSVVQSFYKLFQQLRKKGIAFVFAQMPSKYQEMMHQAGLLPAQDNDFFEYANLDYALEQRENILLENTDAPNTEPRNLRTVFSEQIKENAFSETLFSYLERMDLKPGTAIIQQNTPADDLFFIETGRVSTYAEQVGDAPVRLETMLQDTVVGEIGFYLNQLRTATVKADEASVVYRLSKDALAKMEKDHPLVALELHKIMVKKAALRINHVVNGQKSFI